MNNFFFDILMVYFFSICSLTAPPFTFILFKREEIRKKQMVFYLQTLFVMLF